MDVFTKLFGEFLVFVYHCFDRIVIHGYPPQRADSRRPCVNATARPQLPYRNSAS